MLLLSKFPEKDGVVYLSVDIVIIYLIYRKSLNIKNSNSML